MSGASHAGSAVEAMGLLNKGKQSGGDRDRFWKSKYIGALSVKDFPAGHSWTQTVEQGPASRFVM